MNRNERIPTPSRRQLLQGAGALGVASMTSPLCMPALAQGSPIPLGMVLPFSGATGAYGADMKKAAELVVNKVNGAGGILGGRKLALFIEDSETNPTIGVAATKKLLEVNKVEMVGGFWGSPIALAAQPIIVGAGKVQMVSASADLLTAPPSNQSTRESHYL